MQTTTLVAGAAILLVGWYASAVIRNYLDARKTGLPILICPIDQNSVIWIILGMKLEPYFERYLPTAFYDHIRPSIYGWDWRYKDTFWDRIGPTFILVTAGENFLWSSDVDTCQAILGRRKDFVRLKTVKKIIESYGENLVGSDGDDWQRQRKIVAPTINERIMYRVWDESTTQADQMLAAFAGEPGSSGVFWHKNLETNAVIEGTRTIAVDVLMAVAYGSPYSWKLDPLESVKSTENSKMTFSEAALTIVNNHILATLIATPILKLPIMPKFIRDIGSASGKFPSLARGFVEKEREKTGSSNNLMSVLIKNMGNEAAVDAKGGKASYLSEDEIVGNLFAFTIAGFDTTAGAMGYAFIMLAIDSKLQDWIIEEIDEALRNDSSASYEKTFTQVPRCLALMYETLRLFPPLSHITRGTVAPQTLPGPQSTYVAAGTSTYVAVSRVHILDKFYGPDPLVFRPSRWFSKDAETGKQRLQEPSKQAFLPWSQGPRYCPGIKMAQVEFVAVIRAVFARWRIEPVAKPGQSLDDARKHLQWMIKDSQPKVTLNLRNPQDAVFRFVKR